PTVRFRIRRQTHIKLPSPRILSLPITTILLRYLAYRASISYTRIIMMHIPVICVNGVEVVNVAVDVRRGGKEVAIQPKASPIPGFVEADDAFFNAVVAEIKRRRAPTTQVGKLYQKFKRWNRIRRELKDITLIAKRGEDKRQWSFLMTCSGRAAGIEDYDIVKSVCSGDA
ncbi:hypothetical protein M378DRAFT_154945, partial [Amanita muscaria Koide BX008]